MDVLSPHSSPTAEKVNDLRYVLLYITLFHSFVLYIFLIIYLQAEMHLEFSELQRMLFAEQRKNIEMQNSMQGKYFVCVCMHACTVPKILCSFICIHACINLSTHRHDESHAKYFHRKCEKFGPPDVKMCSVPRKVYTAENTKVYKSWDQCM